MRVCNKYFDSYINSTVFSTILTMYNRKSHKFLCNEKIKNHKFAVQSKNKI